VTASVTCVRRFLWIGGKHWRLLKLLRVISGTKLGGLSQQSGPKFVCNEMSCLFVAGYRGVSWNRTNDKAALHNLVQFSQNKGKPKGSSASCRFSIQFTVRVYSGWNRCGMAFFCSRSEFFCSLLVVVLEAPKTNCLD